MSRCLIVDDIALNREIVRVMMQRLGFKVVEAEHAKDALLLAGEEEFDALLADWHMPDMDGLELIAEIRKSQKGRDMVIFIYSAMEDVAGTRNALKAGADGFIPKPITLEVLEKKLRAVRLI